ncbi:MAG: glycosyltransferase family 39 protein [Deltaproteobacteria bacterium]|nr:glycosyltransferase family 39 protein [Deltaproteobacteria bacterium]
MGDNPAAGSVPFGGGHLDGPLATKRNRVAAAGVLLAVLLFWFAALYGIGSPFYYGHYGYHGGSYATWARGTVRHHTLLPVNEPGFAPPRPGTYYIHHPILTHQLVTLTFAVFGEHEWSVRLAALIPSFASLLLVAAIAWRKIGPLAGAVAALVFAIVPVNVWYSVNIDQGFPSIACLLAFFWFYLRWLETARWSLAAAALAFGALAGGFEWSPYFAFPAIFVHVVWTAAHRRGRYLLFGLLYPLVAVVPLAGHVVVVWKSGMMSDLLGAYHNRAVAVGYRPFLRDMQAYGDTLFGRVLVVAMFVWLIATLARVVMRRGRPVDLVGLTFAFALIAYVHVFKSAVLTHAYRQLYGNVWAALAVADLAARCGRMATWLATRRNSRQRGAGAPWPRAGHIGSAVAIVVGAGILIVTAPIAWAGLKESRAHGGIPGWKTFNPDLRQTAFARQVNVATRPGDVLYIHPTFANPPPSRMDWAFYYDRDLRRGVPLRMLNALSPIERSRAVVIFVPANLSADERQAYAELTKQHAVLMVADLAMLDLRSTRVETRAFALAPIAPAANDGRNALVRWIQGPYPWPRLVPDPARQAAEEERVKATRTAARLAAARPAIPPARTRGPIAGIAPSKVVAPAPTGAIVDQKAKLKPNKLRRRRQGKQQTR